jgi:hypothetical protein
LTPVMTAPSKNLLFSNLALVCLDGNNSDSNSGSDGRHNRLFSRRIMDDNLGDFDM